jgi:uncharacterized protein YlzI (FlbEa/FlbD family)
MNDKVHITEVIFEHDHITPEIRAWLDTSTVSLFSGEKFIVQGDKLLIEDFEGNVIEERTLQGREGQLIGTMIFLQQQQETFEAEPTTQEEVFHRATLLAKQAEKCGTILTMDNGNIYIKPVKEIDDDAKIV